nr:MAG TPA: hypothetical protein [Caudoviricetes sp.]
MKEERFLDELFRINKQMSCGIKLQAGECVFGID